MSARIVLAAGGTGGHLYPAQALAQQVLKRMPEAEILFVAGGLSTNRYFDRTQFAFREVNTPPLSLRRPLKLIGGLASLAKGLWQTDKLLRQFAPALVVGFGSYYTLPVVLAARRRQIPIILHEANSVPGKANQWLSPFASCIGVHFPSTAKYFKKPVIEVGLPLRPGYTPQAVRRDEALSYFALKADQPTLLVFGGSQGAQAINRFMAASVSQLKQPLQVIHLTGDEEATRALTAHYAVQGLEACVKTFESKMHYAWCAADLFIGRAGASTIAEAIAFNVPGILIPYPFANRHQSFNASFFVDIGGGMQVDEQNLTVDTLVSAIHAVMNTRCERAAALVQYDKGRRYDLCDLVLSSLSRL